MLKKLLGVFLSLAAVAAFSTSNGQTITISVSPSDTICSGTTATFTSVVTGGTNYQWLKNGVHITGATTSTYSSSSLINGDAITCELLASPGGAFEALSNTIVMTVESVPVVASISGSDTVCNGGTTTLTDATSGGVWNSTDPFRASVSSSGIVTGVAPGFDTITYSITNSCGSDTATIAMYINVPPFLGPIGGPNTICVSGTATYTDSPAVGTWSLSNTTLATINSSGVVTAGSTVGRDTIFYTATNSCGTTTRRKVVGIASTPLVGPITVVRGSSTICPDSLAVLTDMPTGGMWNSDNTSVAAVLGGIGGTAGIQGVAAGTATIVYVVNNGCGIDSATISITVNPAPEAYPIIGRDSVCPGSSETLIESATDGSWTSSNTSVATVNSSGTATGVAAGVAIISYTATNSCGTVSQEFPLAVYCPDAAVPVVNASAEITIFPNPAHEAFTIQGVDAAHVEIVNMLGQQVCSLRNSNTVPVSNLAQGMYIVTVFDADGNVLARQRVEKM